MFLKFRKSLVLVSILMISMPRTTCAIDGMSLVGITLTGALSVWSWKNAYTENSALAYGNALGWSTSVLAFKVIESYSKVIRGQEKIIENQEKIIKNHVKALKNQEKMCKFLKAEKEES